jgi:type I restriction enzyme M protein
VYPLKNVDPTTCDLSVKNPHRKDEVHRCAHRRKFWKEMKALDEESAEILNSIVDLL